MTTREIEGGMKERGQEGRKEGDDENQFLFRPIFEEIASSTLALVMGSEPMHLQAADADADGWMDET